jgi:hypothetical protein
MVATWISLTSNKILFIPTLFEHYIQTIAYFQFISHLLDELSRAMRGNQR